MRARQRLNELKNLLAENPLQKSFLLSATTLRIVAQLITDQELAEVQIDKLHKERKAFKSRALKAEKEVGMLRNRLAAWQLKAKPKGGMKSNRRIIMEQVEMDIRNERERQNKIHPIEPKTMEEYLVIVAEEFGEVAQAITATQGSSWAKPTDKSDLYMEWIHLAAVSKRAAEQLKGGMANGESISAREN